MTERVIPLRWALTWIVIWVVCDVIMIQFGFFGVTPSTAFRDAVTTIIFVGGLYLSTGRKVPTE